MSDETRYDDRTPVYFHYTNYRGERRIRFVLPLRLEHKASEWHPEPQWVLVGLDMEREDRPERDFALAAIEDCPLFRFAAELDRLRERRAPPMPSDDRIRTLVACPRCGRGMVPGKPCGCEEERKDEADRGTEGEG